MVLSYVPVSSFLSFPMVHQGSQCCLAVERGTRTVTDLSCLTDTCPLGLNIPSLSWRVPVIPYSGGSQSAGYPPGGPIWFTYSHLSSCTVCTLHYLYAKNYIVLYCIGYIVFYCIVLYCIVL